MPSEYVDDDDHLLRHVPWARLRRDENSKVIGVLPQAFKLRSNEAYLSASWVEYFKSSSDPVAAAAQHFTTVLRTKPKDRFVNGRVGAIKSACSDAGVRVRVIRERAPGFDSHCGVHQFRDDNEELLELLASEAWAELYPPI
jgi:hypothetical protein